VLAVDGVLFSRVFTEFATSEKLLPGRCHLFAVDVHLQTRAVPTQLFILRCSSN